MNEPREDNSQIEKKDKKSAKRPKLKKETIQELTDEQMREIAGGRNTPKTK